MRGKKTRDEVIMEINDNIIIIATQRLLDYLKTNSIKSRKEYNEIKKTRKQAMEFINMLGGSYDCTLIKTGEDAKHIKAKLRYSILKRDNFTCQYCGRKAPDIILHIDHIIPYSKGGKTTENNLQASCQDCNLGKSNIL